MRKPYNTQSKKDKKRTDLFTVGTNEYLLSCCRYVELNPVRAGIVPAPEDCRWSSYGEKVGLTKQELLDFDPFYLSLASVQTERQEKYKEFVMGTIPEEEFEQIRQAIQRGQLTCGERFVEEIEVKVGRRIEFRGQGRPCKSRKKSVPFSAECQQRADCMGKT